MKQLKTFNAKPFFLLGIALLSATFFVNAQTTISGNITDSSGPLPGVTILEKGTTNGTVSDFDGNYTLSVANQNSVLVFSYLGFLTQEITSDESGALDVQMQQDVHEDLGVLIFDPDDDGDNDIYFTSGGNEYDPNSQGYADRFYENKGNLNFIQNKNAIPQNRNSNQHISAVDFDHDRDLDLLVGGRLTPKKYPYPSSSFLLENRSSTDSIKFIDVTESKCKELLDIGLVTDSSWVDFNNDGWEDLVLVGEWMPIRFFKNKQGVFQEVTNEVFEVDTNGWWFAVEKGDFDGDGDQDLVLGNLGENYKYQASKEKPFKIYLNDFDKNNKADIVLSYASKKKEFPVRGRECSADQIPAIKVKFKDYNSFANASLQEIYTDKMLDESLSCQVKSFQSVYLENSNGKFIRKPLPTLAQISNINAIVTHDIDQDGNLDFIVGGNLYNSEVETPRNDASFGLWLRGDGEGNFTPIAPYHSGLNIIGDVRNMKLISIHNKNHLLVAKNNDYLQQIRIN